MTSHNDMSAKYRPGQILWHFWGDLEKLERMGCASPTSKTEHDRARVIWIEAVEHLFWRLIPLDCLEKAIRIEVIWAIEILRIAHHLPVKLDSEHVNMNLDARLTKD